MPSPTEAAERNKKLEKMLEELLQALPAGKRSLGGDHGGAAATGEELRTLSVVPERKSSLGPLSTVRRR